MTDPLDLAAVKADLDTTRVWDGEPDPTLTHARALVAEVERLAANLDTFREAIRLLHAHCDDDPDEAAHTPPHIRQAIMDYDQRAALRAAGGG